MTQDEFVIEEAGDKTILVRHLLAGMRFLFVMKDRKFTDVAVDERKPLDLIISLRNQARRFALQEARIHGWID